MKEQAQQGAAGLNLGLGLMGAMVGGAVGYVGVGWLARQGLYGIALPGVLMGVGAGLLSRQSSRLLPGLCGALGLLLGLFTEWHYFPFSRDPSLVYFLGHLGDLQPVSWIMILLGGFAAFYFCWRRSTRRAAASKPSAPTKGEKADP
jgi:hypothetical protein